MIRIRKLASSTHEPTMDFAFIPPGHGVDWFWLQTTPVTVQQWCAVMGLTCGDEEASLPKTHVNIDDIKQFLQRLVEGTQKQFRLPTELEWCRALGVEPEKLEDYAVYGVDKLPPVKTRLPNEYGLYDMRGLVHEWMTTDEEQFSARGGWWYDNQLIARAVIRDGNLPSGRYFNIGFRVILIEE